MLRRIGHRLAPAHRSGRHPALQCWPYFKRRLSFLPLHLKRAYFSYSLLNRRVANRRRCRAAALHWRSFPNHWLAFFGFHVPHLFRISETMRFDFLLYISFTVPALSRCWVKAGSGKFTYVDGVIVKQAHYTDIMLPRLPGG